jgi:poly-beta-hydroxybutyrate-responsive repressor
MRFLEPCLLLVLHSHDAHGYELAEEIQPLGFDARHPVDSSLIYRTLRALEASGMVTSDWDTAASAGPARRVYHLSEAGDRYLTAWMADLRETARMLSAFVAEYEKHMAKGQGDYHNRSQVLTVTASRDEQAAPTGNGC